MFDYNKEGRIIGRNKGPRDLQTKSTGASTVIDNLLLQIRDLKEEVRLLKSYEPVNSELLVSDGLYSDKEFNSKLKEELRKESAIIEKEYEYKLKDVKQHYESTISELKTEIKHLKDIINIKDETIKTLSAKPNIITTTSTIGTEENDRPAIEEVVIDPTEDKELESHIEIEAVKQKEDMTNKLSKLKQVLGK